MFAKLESGRGYDKTFTDHITNPYFNWHGHVETQNLQDVLVAEAIQARGLEVIYILRDTPNLDLVFGEDPTSVFSKHWRISVYVDSFDGYEGEQDWYSKFGFQVEDEMNVTTNPALFAQQTGGLKPRMGNLVYFPLSRGLFEVSWVEVEDPFYSVGDLPMRKMKLKRFVYSGEEIDLPKPELHIDTLDDVLNTDDLDIINGLNGEWDIAINPGAEIEQIQDEVDVFFQGQQVVPNGSDKIPEPPKSNSPVMPPLRTNVNKADNFESL